jgi:hypothetical protein
MLLYKRSARPADQGLVVEDDGALTSLNDFVARAECQKSIVDMFYQRYNGGSTTLQEIIMATRTSNGANKMTLWQRVLRQVAMRVKENSGTSIWLLRDSYTFRGQIDSGKDKIVAVLNEAASSESEVGITCYLVRFSAEDASGDDALLSWEPGKIFKAKHITGPLRKLIAAFELQSSGDATDQAESQGK